MFAALLPGFGSGIMLAQASPYATVAAAVGGGAAVFLAWLLWRTRQDYSLNLSEHAHLLQEEQDKRSQTQREKEALFQESQAKGEMLATLSREIRAHLNGVIGSADLLLDNSLQRRQRELLTTLRTSAESLHQSLNDVLDYSSIDAGSIPIVETPFDLRQPLIETVEQILPHAQLKGLELVMIVAPDLPVAVTGDAAHLKQVLINLMRNAVRFTPSGRVVLRAELPQGSAAPSKQGGTWLHFSISDTGPGIPHEMEATIFERFAPSGTSSPRKFGGSGLELAISKRLVELMGGQIGARSLPDSGSEFWVVLPLTLDPNPPIRVPSHPEDLHVVLLDDQAVSRVAASAMLGRLRVEHDVTETVPKAAALLQDAFETGTQAPVLLIDEAIATGGAEEITRLIAQHDQLKETRIVLLTQDPEVAAGIERGFSLAGYVRKPLLRAEALLGALVGTGVPASGSRAPFEPTPEPAERQPPLVLVVDDDEISRSVTSQLLAHLGCRVELATSGAQAIERTQAGHFDLVFMDCQMPEMDGFATTERIRALAGSAAPPIVALTANIGIKDREHCFAVGMCDFVAKPARKAELARVVKTWIPQANVAVR